MMPDIVIMYQVLYFVFIETYVTIEAQLIVFLADDVPGKRYFKTFVLSLTELRYW